MKKQNCIRRTYLMILLLTTISLLSCNERQRDLTGRVALLEYDQTNDTVDFYIREVLLTDVERDVDVIIDDKAPGINLNISITNKTDKSLLFQQYENYYQSCFIGINPLIRNDTVYFINSFFSNYEIIEPKQTTALEASCTYPLFLFTDQTRYDNTEPILNIIKDMKFFYSPLPMDEVHPGEDTIVLRNNYRLRVDSNTKIKSHSVIR